jgi:geranylgeranylglycerol-phosphate geranylgeranyltransferase
MMALIGVLIGAIVELDLETMLEPMAYPDGHLALLDLLVQDIAVPYILLALLASISAFAVTGAGNALNDFYDRKVDVKAHPERPIPSGRITAKGAYDYAIGLFVIGLAASILINWLCLIIAIVNTALLFSYERSLKAKGLVGNATISYLTASVFLYGGASVLSIRLVVILFLLGFLANLGREVAKDMEDMEADRGHRRTLPITSGKGTAARVSAAFVIIAVVLSLLPILIGLGMTGPLDAMAVDTFDHRLYGAVVTVADVIFIYSCYLVFNDPRKAQSVMKAAMAVALMAFLLGGLFGPYVL